MLCPVRTRAVIALAIVTTPALTGCADIPGTIARASAWRDEARTAQTAVGADLEALEHLRDGIPDHDPDAPTLDAAIAGARARLGALDAAVRHADLILAEMNDPTDPLTHSVALLAPILPAPAQGPVLLGAALIATLFRARQVRKGAGSIVASIQNALKDPEFRAAFDRHADAIRSIQTPTARRMVDEATRPNARPLLRSPI